MVDITCVGFAYNCSNELSQMNVFNDWIISVSTAVARTNTLVNVLILKFWSDFFHAHVMPMWFQILSNVTVLPLLLHTYMAHFID